MSAKRRKNKGFKSAAVAHPIEDKSRPTLPVNSGGRRTIIGICFFLVAIIFVVFGQTSRFEFINYDDSIYVYENPLVTAGLTFKGVAMAFLNGGPHTWDWV